MGFIGYIVKLSALAPFVSPDHAVANAMIETTVHIPVNNVLVGGA